MLDTCYMSGPSCLGVRCPGWTPLYTTTRDPGGYWCVEFDRFLAFKTSEETHSQLGLRNIVSLVHAIHTPWDGHRTAAQLGWFGQWGGTYGSPRQAVSDLEPSSTTVPTSLGRKPSDRLTPPALASHGVIAEAPSTNDLLP